MPNEVVAFTVPEIRQIGEAIARSGLFGIKTPDQAVALCLIAQAEGRHPALAARDYHIISGSPSKKAEAMQRDFLSAGGRIEWHALDDNIADATFSHPSGGSARITWDKERVKRAGLGSNAMHAKYPRQMLRSRVVSEGVRTVWPMATSGMYVPEEVAEFAPQAREAIDVTPKQELDAFADGTTVDRETGEVTEAPVIELARSAAAKGREEFRHFLKTLTDEEFAIVKPLVGTREEPGELTKQATLVDEDRDPFGLPPVDGAAQNSPAGADGQSRHNHTDDERAIVGTQIDGTSKANHMPAGETDDLRIPLPDDADMPYVARTLLALVAEGHDSDRIRLANAAAINRLRDQAPKLHDDVQAALDQRQGTLV